MVEHDLKKNPMATVKDFDTSEHRPYTEKAPNSLEPAQTRTFLAKLLELYPQHYAMAYLGFMTGGRVSIMITLRRSGPDADIDWETGRLLNRRSKGHGPEVRNVVKQKDNFGVPLPQDEYAIFPGCARARAISSPIDFSPSDGCAATMPDVDATRATGVKSRSESNGSFGYSPAFIAKLLLIMSSV